jgi:hypothetical protein
MKLGIGAVLFLMMAMTAMAGPTLETMGPVAPSQNAGTATKIAAATTTAKPLPVAEPLPHPLLLALLIASTFFSIAAATLIAIAMFRSRRRKPEAAETAKKLNDAVTNLAGSLNLVDQKLQLASATVVEKLQAATILTTDHLVPLTAGLDALRGELARVAVIVEEIVTRPAGAPPATAGCVALEHHILSKQWNQFCANKELSAALDSASQQNGWEQLIDELTALVPEDLKPTFDSVMAPWREHRNLVAKLVLVPLLIGGQIPPRKIDAEEAWRAREFAAVLTTAQSSEGSRLLNFRMKTWVTETFLPFADLYLQCYQQAQLEKSGAALLRGVSLVRQLLLLAAVEPIDVTPGETSFDSTRHIGRSTSNDPRFSDGVITGVVRNGFLEGGQQVIRQPEVIVNRTR